MDVYLYTYYLLLTTYFLQLTSYYLLELKKRICDRGHTDCTLHIDKILISTLSIYMDVYLYSYYLLLTTYYSLLTTYYLLLTTY